MTFFKYGNFDVISQSGSGSVTPEDVDRKIEEAMDTVDSKYDDSKIFADRDAFPESGTVDVLYIAQDTGYQYYWDGEYKLLQEALTETEIKNIVV